jgi:hypothetical protein
MFSMLFQHVVSASTAPNISETIAQRTTPPEKKKNEAHCNRPASDVPADPGGVSGRRPSGLRLSSPPGQGPATSDGTSYIIHGDVDLLCFIYGDIWVYKGYIYIYGLIHV